MRSTKLLILTAVVSFFVIYTIVWAILEPIPFPENRQWARLIIIVAISFSIVAIAMAKRGLITYSYFRFIRPLLINHLQTLSTKHSDDSLSEGWFHLQSHSAMRPSIVDDLLFKKVCRFQDESTHDAYHGLKGIAKESARGIDYFIKPISETANKNPVIYVRVELRNITTKKNENKWLTLVIDKVHDKESYELSEGEEVIYVRSKCAFMEWMFFTEDIELIIKKIKRWEGTYAFNKIDGIKVRGSFDLALLVFYK